MYTKTGIMVSFTNVIASEMEFRLNNGGTKIQNPSEYQQEIFRFFREGDGNCDVSAVPGSGKTTTLLHAVGIMPWVQFNTSTIHSIGAKMLHRYLTGRNVPYNMREGKAWHVVRQITKDFPKNDLPIIQYTLRELLDFVRLTGADHNSHTHLLSLCLIYDIQPNTTAIELLPKAVELSNSLAINQGMIDFTDMIYLPNLWNLPPNEIFDFVMVDESQDLNNMQWYMVRRLLNKETGRLFIVGDPRQSMYLFAGASHNTIEQISDLFGGYTKLPLSISYRCPISHVELAKKINPEMQAWEKAKDGIVEYSNPAEFMDKLLPGDMVLCRFNAPLINSCLDLIRQGRRAYVRGKGLHTKLLRILDAMQKTPGFEFEQFGLHLNRWLEKTLMELSGLGASESQMDATRDKALSLAACHTAANAPNIRILKAYIKDLFDPNKQAVQFATIHKAKGLEAERVHVLGYDALPYSTERMSPEQAGQEKNIEYVALTRSTDYMNLVQGE